MRTIFWNVDTQYDFMRNDESFKGTLAIPGARAIEGNLEKLTALAAKERIIVVNTADWHTPESKEFSGTPDYKTTFPPHCLADTLGAEFVPATKPNAQTMGKPFVITCNRPGYGGWPTGVGMTRDLEQGPPSRNFVIRKDAFDVFAGNQWTDTVISWIEPQAAIVYGVATNVCVDYAVMGLRKRGIEIFVPTDAIKELPGCDLEALFKKWTGAGVKLGKTGDVAGYVTRT